VPTHFHAIQQQHGHVQPMAPLQQRIGINVDQREIRQAVRGAQCSQPGLQFLAQAALSPRQQREARTQRGGLTPRSDGSEGTRLLAPTRC
jgi:hypothetical protein